MGKNSCHDWFCMKFLVALAKNLSEPHFNQLFQKKKRAISTIVSSLQSLPQLIWNSLQKLWSRKGWNHTFGTRCCFTHYLTFAFQTKPFPNEPPIALAKWLWVKIENHKNLMQKILKMTNFHGHCCHFHPWYNYKIIYPHNVTMISVSYHHYLFG